MNLPQFSVKRPIFTTMVTLILVLLGAVSLSRLQIDMLPNIELPTLSVRTDYEGASPEVMERLVTQIIEEIVATVPGVEEITSTSSEGRSNIRVSFVWGTDIDTAAIDVQGKIEDEINELPDGIVRPRVRKFDIAGFPVVILGVSSNLDPIELTELIEVQVRYRFARIPGVAQVDVWGGFNREVRIELDPDRINAAGLPLDQVLTALRNANLDLPAGKIEQGRYEGGDEGLTVEIRGYDLALLDALAAKAGRAIADVPGITDVQTSVEAGIPQQAIRIDREKAADLGLSVRDISELLQTAVAGARAGDYRVRGNSYRIWVQLKNADKRSLDEILNQTLTTASGEKVSLRNLVTTEASRGPILIDRKDQQRRATVAANVSGRDLGSVALDVQQRLDRIPRPVGYDLMVAGNFEEQQKASRELLISLLLALVLVYMVLACQYEALKDPLVVMFSVPMAAIGVLVTLFLTRTTLNVQSYIGCIMLGGIVVNNAILLVDQAGRLTSQGMPTRTALIEAGRRRLRPILMTTLTTILGLLPLALGIGEGAETQAPLARAVVGGLTGATLITLVLIPAVYSVFHPDTAKERR